MAPVDELRGPHLVLPDVGHDAIAVARSNESVERRIHVVRHQRPRVGASFVRLMRLVAFLQLANVRQPLGSVIPSEARDLELKCSFLAYARNDTIKSAVMQQDRKSTRLNSSH